MSSASAAAPPAPSTATNAAPPSIPHSFSIEDIIHPDFRAQAEQFECPICLRIPFSPVQTKCCEQVFCKDCLSQLMMCANCCAPFEEERSAPLPKMVQRMFHGLGVICPHGVLKTGGGRPGQEVGGLEGIKEQGTATAGARSGEDEDGGGAGGAMSAPAGGAGPGVVSSTKPSPSGAKGNGDEQHSEVSGAGGVGKTGVGEPDESPSASRDDGFEGGASKGHFFADAAPTPAASTGKKHDSSDEEYCKWEGTYEALNKHLCSCNFAEIKCPKGCGETILRGKLAQHQISCVACVEVCRICQAQVRPGEMEKHRTDNAQFHVQLLETLVVGSKGEGASTSFIGQLLQALVEMRGMVKETTLDISALIKDTMKTTLDMSITWVDLRTHMGADVRTEIQAVKADMATKLAAEREYFVTKLAAERNHLNGEIGVLKEQLAVLKNCGFDRVEWWVKTEDFFEKCLKVKDFAYESPEFHYGTFGECSFRLCLRGIPCSIVPSVYLFMEQTTGSEFIAGLKFKIKLTAKGSEFRAVSGSLDAKGVYDRRRSVLNSRSGLWQGIPTSELRKTKDVLVSVEFDFQGQGASVGCTRVAEGEGEHLKAETGLSALQAVKADMATLKKQLANLQYMLMAVLVIWVASMVTMPRNK